MSKISRRDFLKVTGVAAAAATLTACGGSSSSTASSAASAASSAASSEVVKKLDKISIAVPNDTTNEARALLLLEQEGLIKLKDGVGVTATTKDIASNPKNLQFKELEAAQVSQSLQDVDIAAINSNYALQAGLNVNKDALATEDANGTAAQTYANLLVVKDGNQDSDKIKALAAALNSDEVRDYINNTYDGAVKPVF